MNIIDIKHQEQKKSDEDKSNFKAISNSVTMTKKSDNICPAKIISITQGKYPSSSNNDVQQRFSKEYILFNLNEFLRKEPPIDHVMFLKNFCS